MTVIFALDHWNLEMVAFLANPLDHVPMVGLVESRKIAGGACFAILYSIPIMHHQPANPH